MVAAGRHWRILATAGLAQLMVVLDSTVALPSVQQELGMSDSSRSWVVSAYALAFGGLLLLGGRLSDTLGLLVMAAGMALLIGLDPGVPGLYLTRFLPAEILIGWGLGCALTPAVSAATSGVSGDDTGVASAAVNAVTPLGGSIGTALLNTVAAVATAAVRAAPGGAATDAVVAGFDAALVTAVALLVLAAVAVALVMPRRPGPRSAPAGRETPVVPLGLNDATDRLA
ncbi:MFS transporter [Micromonospora matsumotoense]|uniref:MFS transporter n=1 Tax=Micromonospora matsumotoense TaxID=121616 RepID=UPI0033E5C373